MRGKKARGLISAAVSMALLLSLGGCSLLPKEVEYNSSYLLKDDSIEYSFAYAKRGDLIESVNVVSTYTAVNTEDYCFDRDGKKYSGIFVNVGDKVEKGTLLAELDMEETKDKLEKLKKEKNELELDLEFLKREKELMVERNDLLTQTATKAESMELCSTEEIAADYDIEIKDRQCELENVQAGIESLSAEIEEGRLYAGMDGTVTFVKNISEGSTTIKGVRVVTLGDVENSYFKASTRHTNILVPGFEGFVTIGDEEYKVRVIDASERGIKVSGNDVYFEVLQDVFTLSEGDKGTFELELTRLENVIYVPSEAVSFIGDKAVVFYLNEDGIRTYREVEVGSNVNKQTQIIRGVNEGDQLIIG